MQRGSERPIAPPSEYATDLEARGILPHEQHGFRRDRSELIAQIRCSLTQQKKPFYALVVDYKAAFDTAPRHQECVHPFSSEHLFADRWLISFNFCVNYR